MSIMIGIDPHKASHTAVAIDCHEHVIDEIRVRSSSTQTDQLRCWADRFDDRTWAVESAQGLGYLLASNSSPPAKSCSTSPQCAHRASGR